MIVVLLDIANLQLIPFEDARPAIEENLKGDDLEQYWALIVASSFGDQAKDLTPTITELAKTHANPLVRARAAEFLGLTRGADAAPLLNAALSSSRSEIESLLILNTAALLYDTDPTFTIKPAVKTPFRKNRWVNDRVEYLLTQQSDRDN